MDILELKRRQLEQVAKHWEELRANPRLRWVFFELTDRCNLRCRHCGSDCTSMGQLLPIRDGVCGCPFRTSRANTDGENQEKSCVWLYILDFKRAKTDRENHEKCCAWLYLPDIKSQNRQRKPREKLRVAVHSGVQEPKQTEKTKRKAVSGCTFRTSRANTDRQNYEN